MRIRRRRVVWADQRDLQKGQVKRLVCEGLMRSNCQGLHESISIIVRNINYNIVLFTKLLSGIVQSIDSLDEYTCYVYTHIYALYCIIFSYMQDVLPPSFDPLLSQDQLLMTLKSSPLTQSFAALRARQLILQAVQSTIVQRLKLQLQLERQHHASQIKQYTVHLSQSKKQHRTAKKEQTRIQSQKKTQLTSLQHQINTIKRELSEKDREIESLIQSFERDMAIKEQAIQGLEQQLQQYAEIVNEQKISIEEYEKIVQTMQQEIKIIEKSKNTLQGTSIFSMKKSQEELQAKRKEIESIRDKNEHTMRDIQKEMQQQKVKHIQQLTNIRNEHQKQIYELKQQYIHKQYTTKQKYQQQLLLKSKECSAMKQEEQSAIKRLSLQLSAYKDKYTQFSLHYNTLRTTYNTLQSQHKQQSLYLNQRLLHFTHSRTLHHKLRQQSISKLMRVQRDVAEVRQAINEVPKMISNCNDVVKGMMGSAIDTISAVLSKELVNIAGMLQQKGEEVKMVKRESEEKSEIIKTIEQILMSTKEGAGELILLLREKKRDEERLKRELKRNHQSKEKELDSIEKKYNQILKDKALL